MSRNLKPYYIFNAKAANGVGNKIFVGDFKNVGLTYDTDGGGDAAGVIKFVGSTQEEAPDFSAAQSVTNRWDYIDVIDLEDGASIDGDTGITVATADDHRTLEANASALTWVSAILSGRTAGEFTVTCAPKSNS